MASANGHISSSAISGLRHQIIANATSVFPSIVCAHLEAHDLTHAKASEVFDIVITEILEDTGPAGRFNYKAILVYGSLPRRKIAAEGSIRSGMDAAMESLLILLSEFLDPKRVLVPMEAKWKVKEGAVDRTNAAVVFPKAVAAHLDYHRINFAPPEDIFDIIVTQRRNNGFQAVLIYGRVLDRRMAAASTEGLQVPEVALEALLVTVSQALGKSQFSVIGSARAMNTLNGGKIEVELM